MTYNVKPDRGTLSTLLTNQPSAVATCHRMAHSSSPSKSVSGGVEPLGLRKKICLKCGSQAIKKLKKSCRQSNIAPFFGKIKMRIAVLTSAASTDGASTETSSFFEIPDVEVDEDEALAIFLYSFSGNGGTSSL